MNPFIYKQPRTFKTWTIKNPTSFVMSKLFQVSGISSDIFKQIEAVENDHDASTAAALEVSPEKS